LRRWAHQAANQFGLATQAGRVTPTNADHANPIALLSTIQETTMNTSTASIGLRGLIATAIFGALAASFGAVADADPSPPSVTVKFTDLNISNASGALVLYKRIRAAALGACSYYWFESDADEARCVHDAIANAVTKINQPELSAVFNANYKTSVPDALLSQSR
jgi:UrcA family protein